MSLLIGVDIPLWFKSKQNKKVSESQHRILQAKARLQSEKNDILFKLNDLLVNINKDKSLVTLYENRLFRKPDSLLRQICLPIRWADLIF